jgi:hypothetical protein
LCGEGIVIKKFLRFAHFFKIGIKGERIITKIFSNNVNIFWVFYILPNKNFENLK